MAMKGVESRHVTSRLDIPFMDGEPQEEGALRGQAKNFDHLLLRV